MLVLASQAASKFPGLPSLAFRLSSVHAEEVHVVAFTFAFQDLRSKSPRVAIGVCESWAPAGVRRTKQWLTPGEAYHDAQRVDHDTVFNSRPEVYTTCFSDLATKG